MIDKSNGIFTLESSRSLSAFNRLNRAAKCRGRLTLRTYGACTRVKIKIMSY